ncbi:MAG: DUF4178 domain-containing protein [Acidobacteriota bacterium]|nr:DUF4178 domain-containing protein [Acidobacteriota bacterium]
MSVLQANCPNCAAPIEFKNGSTIVLVCPFCRSAIARTDKKLEDLGKVADLAESESPLQIGLRGVWKNNHFELTGRAQFQHELGGFWDEWYATFSNGWVGWLAEAQGKFYLTFHKPLRENPPSFSQLKLGQIVPQISSKTPLMVTEKGTATAFAADGEIPYQLTPNERTAYADLSGAGDVFATIDYSSNPPLAFVGEQISLGDIGLADVKPAERKARRVAVGAMQCPNCGGAVNLIAPDKTERVTCPFCNSLLDVNQGNLKFLRILAKVENPFVLPIGAEGKFADGAKFRIIGAVVRSVTIEGVQYFWHEYLLYEAKIGFHWLVHSDNHWNFVAPVNAAEVTVNDRTANFDGVSYRIFQDAPARIEYVQGEFYWRVEQGETVRAIDYVNAPLMLSQEVSNSEINWSRGTYQTNAEIEKAFSVKDLPKPYSVAPNQPFTGEFYIKAGLAMLGLLIVVAFLMIPLSGSNSVPLDQQITLDPTANAQTAQTVFSQPFEIKANRNVRITANAPVSNSWADLNVDLINEQNSEVESVDVPIEYYNGVEDGESWSEGGTSQDATLSALPAGNYTLRIEGTWQNFQQPLSVNVKVEQNITRGVNFVLAFLALAILPAFGFFRRRTFESRRWSESMFGSSG